MKRTLIIIAVLALLVPGALLAQDELTLEGLAETVAGLTETVTGLVERIEAVEELFDGPGAIPFDDDIACITAQNGILQDETVLKYKAQYDEWPDLDEVIIVAVVYNNEFDYTVVNYSSSRWGLDEKRVVERWDKCEFAGSGDWWELDE